jgi:hypothetical protein
VKVDATYTPQVIDAVDQYRTTGAMTALMRLYVEVNAKRNIVKPSTPTKVPRKTRAKSPKVVPTFGARFIGAMDELTLTGSPAMLYALVNELDAPVPSPIVNGPVPRVKVRTTAARTPEQWHERHKAQAEAKRANQVAMRARMNDLRANLRDALDAGDLELALQVARYDTTTDGEWRTHHPRRDAELREAVRVAIERIGRDAERMTPTVARFLVIADRQWINKGRRWVMDYAAKVATDRGLRGSLEAGCRNAIATERGAA